MKKRIRTKIEKRENVAATDHEPMVTQEMAEDIAACLTGWKTAKGQPVSAARVIRTLRKQYVPKTDNVIDLDEAIWHHYEELKRIDRIHDDDKREHKQEYIKKAQKHQGSAKPGTPQ